MKTFEEWCGEKGIKIEEVSAILLPTAYKVWGTECYHEAKELKSENEALRNEADENAALSMENKMRADRLEKENGTLRERLEKAMLGKCIYYINSVWNDATMTRKDEVCQGTIDYVCDNFVEVAGLVLKWDEIYFTREAAEARLAELKGGDHE